MLTHICTWEDGKWRRTNAEEASIRFPYSVSSNHKCFICELCGQYVSFTGPGKYARHFKHNKGEEDKECEERSTNYSTTPLKVTDIMLPIKMVIKKDNCEFFIGISPIKKDLLNKHFEKKVIISYGSEKREFLLERLSSVETTYLSVGDALEEEYKVCFPDELKNEEIVPCYSLGYLGEGRLFEKNTGKMVPLDGEVKVGEVYYYLTKKRILRDSAPTIHSEKVLSKRFYLYEIEATDLELETATFFLGLRARLTDAPIGLMLIWPPHREIDESIISNSKENYFMMYGNAKVSVNSDLKSPFIESENEWCLYKLKDETGKDNVLVGRTKVLDYKQVIISKRREESCAPKVEIKDDKGRIIENDICARPPLNNRLFVFSEYDAVLKIRGDKGFYYLEIKAGGIMPVLDITYGTIVQLFVGNSLLRELRIEERRKKATRNDDIFISLVNAKGKPIRVSQAAIGNVAALYKDKRIDAWLRKQKCYLPADALAMIKRDLASKGRTDGWN